MLVLLTDPTLLFLVALKESAVPDYSFLVHVRSLRTY